MYYIMLKFYRIRLKYSRASKMQKRIVIFLILTCCIVVLSSLYSLISQSHSKNTNRLSFYEMMIENENISPDNFQETISEEIISENIRNRKLGTKSEVSDEEEDEDETRYSEEILEKLRNEMKAQKFNPQSTEAVKADKNNDNGDDDVGATEKSEKKPLETNTLDSGLRYQNTKVIKYLLTKFLPIVLDSVPKFSYQLPNEQSSNEISNHKNRRKRKNRKPKGGNFVPRKYGKNGIVNIAIHDNGDEFPVLSENFLRECLILPLDMFNDLRQNHKYFVENIPETYDEGTYSGEGIVLIGGGKFSWLSLLGVENLRSVGSKLPIEVMIPTIEEYEPYLCENILPRLNAKCLLLYQVLPKLTTHKNWDSFTIGGYQLKPMALLVSSFEKVLFLDSDNIAVVNPDSLFSSDPFLSNGMILWPDFWRRVTHPSYYDLTDSEISEKRVRNLNDQISPPELYVNANDDPINDIPLHDREGSISDLSTESGQILINKKTHFKALLLNFYYNFFGPKQYYPLFSQGGKGEGDKETFYAAAQFFNLPVYQVRKCVSSVGHWTDDGYAGVGMVQYNPIIDKINEEEFSVKLENNEIDYNENAFNDYLASNEISKPMFIHCNFPKLDPIGLFDNKKLVDSNSGQPWRLYRDQPKIGFDFELKQWEIIDKYFCSIGGIELKYLKSMNVKSIDYCKLIGNRLKFLQATKDSIEF